MCASCFLLSCDLQSHVLLWSFSLWSHRYACILLAKYAYDCCVIHNCSLVSGLVFFFSSFSELGFLCFHACWFVAVMLSDLKSYLRNLFFSCWVCSQS
jgi:hypothetical protein